MKGVNKILKNINNLEYSVSKYTKEEIQNKTETFKNMVKKEEDLYLILPEAFAMVREVVKRITGKRLYDVQIIGGYYLNQGRIAEIKAGEGKTLTESLPAYLNALTKKGVHIITTNEYLAKRDFEEVGKILEYLGLSVGLIYEGMKIENRKQAYKCDVTYGVSTEFGFDYLRDNIAQNIEDIVQRNLNYAIIDEADSVLLDEAQTPMIISKKEKELSEKEYIKAKEFVDTLKGRKIIKENIKDKNQQTENEKYDYVIDETYKTVELTQKGISKAEKEYNIENYFDIQNYKIMNYVKQALISKEILKKDVDYIIWDDEIKLVDKFTGRIMEGKRFTGGLQQAIETKEKLQIKEKSKIIANMTIQNYFKMYKKLSGMTGTAKTSEKEFNVIYNLDVITVPENRKSKRIDRKDKIFRTKKEKYKKLVEEIRKSKEKRQPVLIGTATIKTSEELSKILKKENIKHNILNAKNNEKEAEIIKEAGNIGKITIATNMAGRGTNILLGGEKEKNKKEVIKAGGLKVIGTEKHESSRIDEQLRGRSGRQGEVGESIFLLSLEDELIRIYGNKKYINPKNKFIYAQKNVENRNYTTRKRIVKYDEILDIQRKLIYDNRKKVLSNDIEKVIKGFISYYCDNVIKNLNEIDERIISNLEQQEKIIINENTIEIIKEKIYDKYCLKEKEQGDKIKEIVKKCLLKIIDENWIEHLEIMENIKSNMELRVYGGYDPIVEYKIEGRKEFDFMIYKIKMNFINEILFGKKYI